MEAWFENAESRGPLQKRLPHVTISKLSPFLVLSFRSILASEHPGNEMMSAINRHLLGAGNHWLLISFEKFCCCWNCSKRTTLLRWRVDERTLEGNPDLFRSFLLNVNGGAVERVLALNVLFVHLTWLQFEESVHVKILELWRVEYQIGQVTVATLIAVGDACEKRN